MYEKLKISKELYWKTYNEHKDKLGVFSTISSPAGSWHNPCHGEMMTEWGFPEDDIPFLGIHEKWDADEFDPCIRSNIRIDYWLCIKLNDAVD